MGTRGGHLDPQILDLREEAMHEPIDTSTLAGLRVLLAENESVIALDLEVMLQRLGCSICNITISVADTLNHLDQDRPDAVVLNPRLNDGSALPVAEVLRRQQIPFVLVKDGVSQPLNDPIWQEAPRLNWPYGSNRLGHVLLLALAHVPPIESLSLK